MLHGVVLKHRWVHRLTNVARSKYEEDLELQGCQTYGSSDNGDLSVPGTLDYQQVGAGSSLRLFKATARCVQLHDVRAVPRTPKKSYRNAHSPLEGYGQCK